MTTPLLSICIPTWNRADLLEPGLEYLLEYCRLHSPRIEVVVADNASTDRTPTVAARWRHDPNFRYFRREHNITGNGNIVQTPRDFARGEYTWVIGDDDVILPGALSKLIDLLTTYPDVDYFITNYSHESLDQRNSLIRVRPTAYSPPADTLICPDLTVGRYDSLARVLELAQGDFRFLTHVVGQITRTRRWREVRLSSEIFSPNMSFQTLEDTFPHLMLLLQGAKSRPVVYCGQPLVLASIGGQAWANIKWLDCLYRCHELRLHWREQGVAPGHLHLMQRIWIRQWTGDLGNIWFHSSGPKIRIGLVMKFLFRSLSQPFFLLGRFLPLLTKKAYVTLPETGKRLWRVIRPERPVAAVVPEKTGISRPL